MCKASSKYLIKLRMTGNREMTKKARTLTKRRIDQVLNEAKNARERTMLLLSIKAGLRAKEIAGLLWEQVDFEDGLLLLKETKGDKPRRVPIAKDLKEALLQLEKERSIGQDYVFLTCRRPFRRLTANAVAQWFREFYQKRMGWEEYSSHSGRRTFVTIAARRIVEVGGSLKDVQALAGHSDIRTTSGYIDTDEDAQRKVVELL